MEQPVISFATDNTLPVLAKTAAVVAAAGAAGVFVIPRWSKRILPKPKENKLGAFLPFESIDPDGRTVRCKGGILCQFLALTGIDQNFLQDSDAIQMARARQRLYDQLSETGVTLRYFVLRVPFPIDPPTFYPNQYASELANRWNQQFKRAYKTQMVLLVSRKGVEETDKQQLEIAMNTAEGILSPYGPKMLTQNEKDSPAKDMTIGSFLGHLISPISRPSPRFYGEDLSEALAADEVHFLPNGRIRFRSGGKEKFASVLGVKRFGVDVNAAMADDLTSLPYEITIFQSITPLPKTATLLKLQQQKTMMGNASLSRIDVMSQYQEMIEMVEGLDENRRCLCQFNETIFAFGDTVEEMEEAEKKCREVLTMHGATPAIEKGATQASWFHQFPSFEDRPRPYRLTSTNIAMLATFDRTPTGLPRSDWGPGPISLFYTGANTVYSFQFHDRPGDAAVGHGVCIAPTGSGKTFLMEFLSCMASRHKDLRHFFFDRLQGTYVYTTAMNGKYLGFNSLPLTQSIKGGMNPFQCDKTEENIEFLKNFLRTISGIDIQDNDGIEQIANAVEMAFDNLDYNERSLVKIYGDAFTPGTAVRDQLRKWVDPSQYGLMFNAEKDSIDLEGNWLTTFDMTDLFNDSVLASASVAYISHRIRQTMRRHRAPGLIFIDETAPLLENKNFHALFKTMLQEFRKIRGVVISVFQRPQAMRETGTSDLIRSQCSTYYLFQNPGSNADDYVDFDLTERELDFVLGRMSVARRTVRPPLLIKRPQAQESVVLDIDLSGMGPITRILSSSARDAGLASDLQAQFGKDQWIRRYIETDFG